MRPVALSWLVGRKRAVWLVIAAGLLAGGPSWAQTVTQPVLDAAGVESELRALEAAHAKAIDSKDIEAILQFYSPELITMPGTEPFLRGREWIRSTMAELYRTYEFHEEFRLSDLRVYGDRVAATLQYKQRMTPLAGGQPIVETGKGICILKRLAPGRWQIEWNAYVPDATPKAAEREAP